MSSYSVTKNFSFVIDGESVPVNPFEARLLQIDSKESQHNPKYQKNKT